MLNDIELEVLEAYRDGSDLGYIIENLNISHNKVKSILINLKESSRYKRTFTDEFKMMIAERDTNGVSRRQISLELEINANTVKRACEKFGQSFKEKATSDNEFTVMDRVYDMSKCPSCGNEKINKVDDKTTYCKKCGNEHVHNEDHTLKVNWEYLD